MACGSCQKSKGIRGYVVRRPGQAPREVASEQAAVALVKGVPGGTYSPKTGAGK